MKEWKTESQGGDWEDEKHTTKGVSKNMKTPPKGNWQYKKYTKKGDLWTWKIHNQRVFETRKNTTKGEMGEWKTQRGTEIKTQWKGNGEDERHTTKRELRT